MKIKMLALLVCHLLYLTPAFSQTEAVEKQAIYANVGTVVFENQVSINFERLLFASSPKFQTRLKLNAGTYLSNNYDYDETAEIYDSYLSASILQLLPLGQVQLELNIGLARTRFTTPVDSQQQIQYRAYSLAGIRYSENGWLIRTGFGNLELLHLGIGYQF